jgi:pyruvate,water dikinase
MYSAEQTMSLISPLASAHSSAEYGSKAATLAQLSSVVAVRVPPGFAVSKSLFRQVIERTLPPSQWPERLIAGPRHERNEGVLAQIRERLAQAALPEKTWTELREAMKLLRTDYVAVRSSATHEDGTDYSGAGVFKTILGVSTEAQLLQAIREAFSAMYERSALEYVAHRNPKELPAIALIVQRMVNADHAGVLFTEDPVRRQAGTMRIEACVGLGVSVVDGTTQPDVYLVDRATAAVVDRVIAKKTTATRLKSDGGVEVVQLLSDTIATLSDSQIAEVVATGRAVERLLGAGRDIEFCFEGSLLWIVQARPIAVAPEPTAERSRWVWSNVNVGEALPGVATPLTWSIAAQFSDLGFRRAFASLGCTVPEDAQLVGRFHGRIYLNLTHFLTIAAQVPALDPKLLLEFGGGGGLDELTAQVQKGSWLKFALRAPAVLAQFVAENAKLDRTVEQFERDFAAFRAAFAQLDWDAFTRASMGLEFERLHALLDRTGALMLTCASGSLSSTLLVRYFLERTTSAPEAQQMLQELLTANSDLESAKPGIALAHLAIAIAANAEAKSILLSKNSSELRARDFAQTVVWKQMSAFFDAFGFRAVREAELATPRWREDPSFVFAALRAQLEGGAQQALARADEQTRVRQNAERRWMHSLPSALRPLARHALGRARKFLRLRERMRSRVTELLGFFRVAALAVSKRLVATEQNVRPDDAFFLEVAELREFFRGGALDAPTLIASRRAAFLRDMARPEPPQSFVGAPPSSPLINEAAAQKVWTGVPASPGVVRGPARVVRSAEEGSALLPGEILVVRVADVGWTPLFLIAAGLVTELGGALSHASLVAREYGLPAVVNVDGILDSLANGDLLVIDGSRGVVSKLDPSHAHHDAEQKAHAVEVR